MIKSLQGLRVLFALMVFYHHFTKPQIAQFGLCAVAAFFMLSGFVMSAGYRNKVLSGSFCFKDYFRKRIRKIYPVYLLSIVFAILVCIIQILVSEEPNYIRQIIGKIVFTIPSLFCLQSFIPISGVYFGGNAVAWFLSDILFFYLVFPWVCRRIFLSGSKYNVCSFIVLLLIYVGIMLIVPENWCHPILYINPIIRSFDFITGIYLYKLFDYLLSLSNKSQFNKFINNWSSYILMEFAVWGILIFFLLVAEGMNLRYTAALFWGIPIALLVLFYSILECKYSRISRALYLISGGGQIYYGVLSVSWHNNRYLAFFSFL